MKETIKQLEQMLNVRKEQKEIIECAGGTCINCNPDIQALETAIVELKNIVKLEKENIRLKYQDIPYLKGTIKGYKARIEELEEGRKSGELSDGYHSFNDLYYQRCILFASICNSNSSIAWKSRRHSDGKLCFDNENWFIVGIDTPKGSYTYHYEMKYWELFNVPELEKGKEWDGHTEKDVTRLLDLIQKEDSIPKSVIRDKIEETKQEDYFKKYYFDYQVNLYDFEIGYKKCLKEILGEE